MISDIYNRIAKRKSDSHKGDYGHVYVLAGSSHYTGAPYLTSQAALLAGSGLVTLGLPKSIYPILAEKLIEAMIHPLAETSEASFGLAAEKEIIKFSSKTDVIAIGPGISLNKETQELVRGLGAKIEKPFVIDADGISALAGHLEILTCRKVSTVLTPHPGEFGRLLNKDAKGVQADRKRLALDFSQGYNVVLVLKGDATVVANPDGRVYINETGNPGMATGGVGDVLTGIIASFIGQGLNAYEAAVLGVHVHGLAGDIAAKEKGALSLIATDLLNKIPEAFKALA